MMRQTRERSDKIRTSFNVAAAAAEVKFNGGMAFYNIAESGALVSVSIAGTKYWVSDDLNKKGR